MTFRNEYYFLSNMYPCDITINVAGDNITLRCSEAAFQALKCQNLDDIKRFMSIDGYAAKKLGRTVTLRSDWESAKLDVMRYVLKCKFTQHPELAVKLKSIDDEIVEENTWHDTFWGVCNSIGQNYLGKLLMELRDELRAT